MPEVLQNLRMYIQSMDFNIRRVLRPLTEQQLVVDSGRS